MDKPSRGFCGTQLVALGAPRELADAGGDGVDRVGVHRPRVHAEAGQRRSLQLLVDGRPCAVEGGGRLECAVNRDLAPLDWVPVGVSRIPLPFSLSVRVG